MSVLNVPTRMCRILILATIALTINAQAAEMGGISIHGSLSATAAESDKYNFYGNTDGKFDVIQKEMTLNGAHRFDNGLRAAAQVYAAQTAGYTSISLDFANLDYSFDPKFGIRAGRNKNPQGFYNEVLDVDQIRIFASLPLAFYQRGLRSLSEGYNGGALYGSFQLGSNRGSLEYQVFGGTMGNIKKEEPFLLGTVPQGMIPDGIALNAAYGIALVWNTSIEGLRVGYTYTYLPAILSRNLFATPPAAGQPVDTTVEVNIHVGSIEYTRGKWTAAAEYKYSLEPSSTDIPAFGVRNQKSETSSKIWYGQVTYQATKALGLGIYYCSADADPKHTDPRPEKFTTVKDTAFAASYAFSSWCVVKAEYHFLNGLTNLNEVADSNPLASDPHWNYLVLKTTLSF